MWLANLPAEHFANADTWCDLEIAATDGGLALSVIGDNIFAACENDSALHTHVNLYVVDAAGLLGLNALVNRKLSGRTFVGN